MTERRGAIGMRKQEEEKERKGAGFDIVLLGPH